MILGARVCANTIYFQKIVDLLCFSREAILLSRGSFSHLQIVLFAEIRFNGKFNQIQLNRLEQSSKLNSSRKSKLFNKFISDFDACPSGWGQNFVFWNWIFSAANNWSIWINGIEWIFPCSGTFDTAVYAIENEKIHAGHLWDIDKDLNRCFHSQQFNSAKCCVGEQTTAKAYDDHNREKAKPNA